MFDRCRKGKETALIPFQPKPIIRVCDGRGNLGSVAEKLPIQLLHLTWLHCSLHFGGMRTSNSFSPQRRRGYTEIRRGKQRRKKEKERVVFSPSFAPSDKTLRSLCPSLRLCGEIVLLMIALVALVAPPLHAQKKAQPTTKPKATTQKPKQPASKPAAEPDEKLGDLQPTPPPKPPLNPNQPLGRIVLVPLDDRPAVAQFAQMIGAIGDYEIVMPPHEMLGKFTTPGDTKKLRDWLSIVNYGKIDAIVISVDMLAYGGLVASRAADTTQTDALKRLEFFHWLKNKHPTVPVYAFNVLMRVAPTASKETRGWRDDLARWAELMDRAPKTNDAKLKAELEQLKTKLDRQVMDNYLTARRRDLQVNLAMIKLYEDRVIDNLIFLQDDAREYGLHRHDQLILHERLKARGFADEVPIYNGADEGSLSLVARATLDKHKQKIKVAVVYSSEKGRKIIAPYEDHPLEFTVENQIKAAGGQLVAANEAPDYTLYVNAPETTASEFTMFSKNLVADLKAGKAVALADVLFPAPHFSGADERLVTILKAEKLIDKLTSYAAWNTAGNTLGTAIPAANLRVFSKQLTEAPERAARTSVSHFEFLLHRFAGDYLYHNIVRFDINAQLRKPPAVPTDEFTDEMYNRINKQVQEKLQPLIEKFFAENFQGRVHPLGTFNEQKRELKLNTLKGLKIYLPWPRTFESTIEYQFDYTIN